MLLAYLVTSSLFVTPYLSTNAHCARTIFAREQGNNTVPHQLCQCESVLIYVFVIRFESARKKNAPIYGGVLMGW